MRTEWLLGVCCDQPFLRTTLLHGMMSHSDCDTDAVVSRTIERLQPMPGLYRKSCLPIVEDALARGERRMQDVLERLSLCELAGKNLDRVDLEQSSFINVNTLTDLQRARWFTANV